MKLAVLVLTGVMLLPSPAGAIVVGKEGTTYPIKERSFQDVINERVEKFDFEAWKLDQQLRVSDTANKFRPADAVADLPVATSSSAYRVDLTYTLPYDIKDIQGNVIYPAGFTFNPLEQMAKQGLGLSRVIVVLNGENENELAWFQNKFSDLAPEEVVLLVTNGHAIEIAGKLRRQVQYLPQILKERFVIKATPSVVVQRPREKYLMVRTYVLDRTGKEMRVNPRKKR